MKASPRICAVDDDMCIAARRVVFGVIGVSAVWALAKLFGELIIIWAAVACLSDGWGSRNGSEARLRNENDEGREKALSRSVYNYKY